MRLELNEMGLSEMNESEMNDSNGGLIPVLAIYACWGVMICCSAVALGMKEALKEHNAK